MIALSEREVRDQLAAALEPLDPPPPPLDELRSRAKRRTKRFRWGGAGVLAVAAAALVAVLVVVIPGNGADKTPVQVASAPTRASLTSFAKAHGGKHIAGPLRGAGPTAGYFGAYATKRALVVVRYTGARWSPDGPDITGLGGGQVVQKIGPGPQTSLDRPSFAVRTVGGDVSYYGGVLVYPDSVSGWSAANFGTCGHHKLCYAGQNEPYGHVDKDGFVSIMNTCTPNCAEGNDFRVQWHWSRGKFVATSETPVKE